MGVFLNGTLSLFKPMKMLMVFIALSLNIASVKAVETVFWVDNQSGVAMSGYDPMSYFLGGYGRRGTAEYEYFWEGAVWRFESEGNLMAFRDNPLTYAPQFGGYDATKMAGDLRVSPDPQYGDLYKNRLYLFHSQRNLNEWLELKNKHVKAAQKNWISLYKYSISNNFVVEQIEMEEPLEFAVAENEEIESIVPEEVIEEIPYEEEILYEEEIPDLPATPKLDSADRMGAAGAYFKEQRK